MTVDVDLLPVIDNHQPSVIHVLIQRPKNIAVLESVFGDLLGRSVRLVIHAKRERQVDPQLKKEQVSRLKQEALSHPLVAETVEIFNGKVVDVKIL